MSANEPFPMKSQVILRRFCGDGWQLMAAYPAGYTVPSVGMPMERLKLNDLSAVYARLLDHHEDEKIATGHPEARDESSPTGTIPDGALVFIERRRDGWHLTVDYPSGGLSGRATPYHSLGAALEGLKLNYSVS